MDPKKLAAKVKADWLEGKRRYAALVELNDLDPDDPMLVLFRRMLHRLAINREYVFAVKDDGDEAPKESLRVRSDSHRVYKRLRKAIASYADANGLERLSGTYEIGKRARSRNRIIPPVFVEDDLPVAEVLHLDGWQMPPADVLDL
jgi:hypothetical protein